MKRIIVALFAVALACAASAQDIYNPQVDASKLTTGTLAAARGGAGTVNGVLAGNGSGVVSQGTCAGLSDGTANCSAAVGQIPGTATNDNASVGKVGEVIAATQPFATAVSLSTTSAANIISISLTAGDWDVTGNVVFEASGSAAPTLVEAWTSTTSASAPGQVANSGGFTRLEAAFAANSRQVLSAGSQRFSLGSTTTIYLSALANFSVGSVSGYGYIKARRVR